MTVEDGSTMPAASDADAKLGNQFKDAEAEAEPYLGTDESAGDDNRDDDHDALGADADLQDGRRSSAEETQDGLPGVSAAVGLRRS